MVESLVLRPRVTARVFSVFSLNREFDEPPAEALHLLPRGGTQVVSRSHRAKPSRRGNGLQTGHARSNHENAAGSNGSRSRREHWKNARRSIRGKHNSLIATNRGHRGKHVHAL